MPKKFIYIYFLLLFHALSYGQTLSGIVSNDTSGALLKNVFVQIKDVNDNSIILGFAKTNAKGYYTIDLASIITASNAQEFIIEATKPNFTKPIKKLQLKNDKRNYTLDFTLQEDQIFLEEINVIGKIKAIKHRNDTVIYNVEAFKNGNETTVEDILKNLPGIEIDEESGAISYDGKPVKRVLLENDDLFGNNYTAGTRNISSDIIKEVQAIDRWSKNPLLKDIQNSELVALNLKLKKGAVDFSGIAKAGIGNNQRRNAGINGISVSKKYKNFTSLSHNNIAKNSSSYNYFTRTISIDQQERRLFLADNLIPDLFYQGLLHSSRSNDNNQWYGAINHIHNLSENLSIRLNGAYMKDDFRFFKSHLTEFNLNGEKLITKNADDVHKKPEVKDLGLLITWSPNNKSILELETKWLNENVVTSIISTINNTPNVQQNLESKHKLWMQSAQYTKKFNKTSAYLINFNIATDQSPQKLLISPILSFNDDAFTNNGNLTQASDVSKTKVNLESVYMSQTQRGNKFQLGFYTDYSQQELRSLLNATNDKNNLQYNLFEANINGQYHFNLLGLGFQPEIKAKFYNIERINESIITQFPKYVVDAKFLINKTFKDINQFNFQTTYSQKPQLLDNVYENYIITPYRALRKNKYNNSLMKTWHSSLQYRRNDITKQFMGQFTLTYLKRYNHRFIENIIAENFSKHIYSLESKNSNNIVSEILVEKYIPFLSSTARIKSKYSISNYYNKLNSDNFRENINNRLTTELFLKTALDIPFNIENILRSMYFKSNPKNRKGFSNHSIINETNLYYTPNKTWFYALSGKYYTSSLNTNNAIYFMDFSIRYKPKKKKWKIGVEGKNLTNNSNFIQYEVSDFYSSKKLQSLNKRYIYLNLWISF